MTDGRKECITRTLEAAAARLKGIEWARLVIHDDSEDPAYSRWLAETWPAAEVLASETQRLGFGGAIARAWRYLTATAEIDIARFVFHLEDDFVMTRDVRVDHMAHVLDHRQVLVQLALRRQPWNSEERAAGGVVELNPGAYTEFKSGFNLGWLEHRLFWTTNPSLYRRGLCGRGWPTEPRSEGLFTAALLDTTPDLRFGYWGRRDSGEWCEHIGTTRLGTGY